MAELPMLPVATDALIADTTHMTAEQFGAYVRLLLAMWRAGGTLPDNGAGELARITGVSVKRWDAICEPVLRPLTITDGILTQKRLSKTWQEVQRIRLKRKMASEERWHRSRLRNHPNAYPNGHPKQMQGGAYPDGMLTKTKEYITSTFVGAAREAASQAEPVDQSQITTAGRARGGDREEGLGGVMLALLDTSQDLDDCAAELNNQVGQLVTSHKRPLRDPARPWAIDNRAYVGFQADAFLALLARYEPHRETCLFVTVPDVVASARRSLEVFERWAPRLVGWRLAFACQDGQEDLPLPWDAIDAVFIGGSTNWKGSQAVVQIIQAAQLLGKHVHVGRVNGAERWQHFQMLGVDTVDGSGIARFSIWRQAIANRHQQGVMFA